MARPSAFLHANVLLRAPKGLEGCADLPVFTDGTQCISFWEFSYEDWHRVVRMGGVFISVLSGNTAPPISLITVPVFDGQSENIAMTSINNQGQVVSSVEELSAAEMKKALQDPQIRAMVRQLAAVKSIVGEPHAQDRLMQDVATFHSAFGHPVRYIPQLDPASDELRLKLLREEVKEFADAQAAGDLVGMADALEDIIYVAIGAKLTYGFPAEGWEEVQRSNMSKLGADGKPLLRDDGKVMKGPNYTPPNFSVILMGAGWLPPATADETQGTPG